MPQFDRLGNDMSDDVADALADEADKADKAHEDRTAALVAAVKKHAEANYNQGGWDMVVECYEDSEIAEEIAGCTTEEEAIARLAEVAGIYHDRRLDAWLAGGLDENGREPSEKQEPVSHNHCTCECEEDVCEFCSYTMWMHDLKESGPTCDDGGFRYSKGSCYNQSGNIYGTYIGCYVTQEALDNECPF